MNISELWGKPMSYMLCGHCDRAYLVPESLIPPVCPYCPLIKLSPMSTAEIPPFRLHPPELMIPFSVGADTVNQALQQFSRAVPFAPSDLTFSRLQKRVKLFFIPRWLLDCEVQAIWKAEAGFNYEVVSHQEHYHQNRNDWSSRQVREERTRWELRLGQLRRRYENIVAPALEDHRLIKIQIGEYRTHSVQPYQSDTLGNAFVRLPDRTPADAWSEAEIALQNTAAEECRLAATADHIRQFSWQPDFSNQNWTLQLMPVYSTYYLDDDNNPQPVWLHGQTGALYGRRRASFKQAQKNTFALLIAAGIFFILALALTVLTVIFPPAAILGGIGILLALVLGGGAFIPLGIVWWFNRQ